MVTMSISHRRDKVAIATVFAASVLAVTASGANAQLVNLEALRRDGYGVVQLTRPRPNVLAAAATIDGRKARLIVDTGWAAQGISLQTDMAGALAASAQAVADFPAGARNGKITGVRAARAQRLLLGNVQLAQVPVFVADFSHLRNLVARRALGANGVVGAEFLRTCSAIIDLQNLRLYLRPPGMGRRADLSAAMRGIGLAEARFEQTVKYDCVVDVEINDVPGKMFIDTGTYHAVVDIRLAAQMKARPFVTRAGHSRPQTSDEFENITRMDPHRREVAALVDDAPMTPLRSFKIGGVPVKAPDIRLRRLPFLLGKWLPHGRPAWHGHSRPERHCDRLQPAKALLLPGGIMSGRTG